MKVLLDTHAFLWAVMEPSKLSPRIRRLLEDPETGVVISVASAWEIATKFRLGRLPGAADVVADYDAAIRGLRAQVLPIENGHALAAGGFPQVHRDPFDRLIVAQAAIEGIVLVSKDRVLRQFGVEVLW